MLDSLDNKDLAIIRQLQENSRTPFGKIGSKLGLSEGAVRARVKRLIKSNVIQRFTITLNQQLTGVRLLARIGVDAQPSELKTIASELSKFEEVYFVALATGNHDVLVDVLTTDIEDLKKFLTDKLGTTRGVRGSDTSIVMEVYKWRGSYQYKL
jgi:Lrp/AsnC family transcriptional regulator for asnA, asnC and gidA